MTCTGYVNITYMQSLWENDAIYLDELIDMNRYVCMCRIWVQFKQNVRTWFKKVFI